jgi:hypothetical protein
MKGRMERKRLHVMTCEGEIKLVSGGNFSSFDEMKLDVKTLSSNEIYFISCKDYLY